MNEILFSTWKEAEEALKVNSMVSYFLPLFIFELAFAVFVYFLATGITIGLATISGAANYDIIAKYRSLMDYKSEHQFWLGVGILVATLSIFVVSLDIRLAWLRVIGKAYGFRIRELEHDMRILPFLAIIVPSTILRLVTSDYWTISEVLSELMSYIKFTLSCFAGVFIAGMITSMLGILYKRRHPISLTPIT